MRYDYCATIGFFDGVHRGHQFMIDSLTEMAHARGRQSLVITFDRHPRQVVHDDYIPQLITTADEKLQLLKATAADRIEVLHFDTEMAQLSAYEFMRRVLHEKYGVALLLTGYDNRFGHNRAEGFDDYVRYGKDMGMEVLQNTPIDIDGMRVSSSLIRRLIVEGNITEASNCMGHPYSITGSVAHGFQEGRRIGFPTANIVPESTEKLVPQNGVYATRVSIEGGEWMPRMYHLPSQRTDSLTFLTCSAILAYSAASFVSPSCPARAIKFRSAQWCRKLTMALSPPPRFRQSFQSARRPLQMPLIPTCRAEKSRMRFICS